jgi:Flp pilus assembly pilin Flp
MLEASDRVMRRVQSEMQALLRREEGQSMVEYGLLLLGIAIAVIAVVFLLGDNIRDLFEEATNSLENPPN